MGNGLKTNALRELGRQLTDVGLKAIANDADSVKQIFPFVDKLIQSNSSTKKQLPGVITGYASYVKDIVDANAAQTDAEKAEYLNASRQQFVERMQTEGISNISKSDLEGIEQGMAKLGLVSHVQSGEVEAQPKAKAKQKPAPVNQAQQEAADGINDASETQEAVEDLADNMELLSKKLTETFAPVVEHVAKKPESFMDLMELFQKLKGDKDVKFTESDLKAVKKGLYDALVDGDMAQVEKFLNGIENEGVKFHLAQYVQATLVPAASGGHGIKVSTNVDKALQGDLGKALNTLVAGDLTKERTKAPEQEDVSVILEKRDYIANSIIEIAEQAKVHKETIPGFKVPEFFAKELAKLEGHVLEKTGASVTLYKDDLKLIADHLKATENVSQKEQKSNFNNFIQEYGKYAIGIVPFVLGPIASVLSRIPVIGKPIAQLVPGINHLVQTAAPALLTLLATNGMRGANSEQNSASYAEKAA